MIAQAALEAEQLREQARAEGYAEGRRAGHEDVLTELSRAASAFGEAVQGIESLRAEVVDAIERDAIKLALELAGKILEGAFEVRNELVLEVVRGALRRVSDRRKIAILVNSVDLETMRSALDELTVAGSGIEICDLQPGEDVGIGGAIVRTSEGEVDVSVSTQLERAREVVAASLQRAERAA
jgi:flagellar assembly protein FliH